MKVLFRCDSSFSIGSGHLIRCLNLAELLQLETVFLCRKLSGNINLRVQQNQFKLIELPDISDYRIGTSIEETREIEAVLQKERPDIIIVDHYGLHKEWEVVVRKYCRILVALDDLGREHIVDGILDQNYRLKVPFQYQQSGAKLFLGPQYCILNKNFLNAKVPSRSFEKVKNVLVFFGGSDLDSMTLKTLALSDFFSPDIQWNVVIGQQNQNIEKILAQSAGHPNMHIHININNMHELMQQADIFLGAGGTTTWERAKLGLPSIVVSIAENQEEISQELSEQRAITYFGKSTEFEFDRFLKLTNEIFNSPEQRGLMNMKSLELDVCSKLDSFIQFIKTF